MIIPGIGTFIRSSVQVWMQMAIIIDVYNVSMDEPAVESGTCTVYFVLVGEQGAQGPAGVDGSSANYTTSFDGPTLLETIEIREKLWER